MASIISIANPVLSQAWLRSLVYAVDKALQGLTTDSVSLAGEIATLTTTTGFLNTALVRAAVVATDITASAGWPLKGAGTIQLISLDNPAVLEEATLPAYTYDLTGFVANTVVFVVSLNGSYYVIS